MAAQAIQAPGRGGATAISFVPHRQAVLIWMRLWIVLSALLLAAIPQQAAEARHPAGHLAGHGTIRTAHFHATHRHAVARLGTASMPARPASRGWSRAKGSNTDVPPAVIHAIQAANRQVQADPVVLLSIAWQESRFDPRARNHFSSARGLLQFTTATWLTAIRDFGEKHGLGRYAAAIRTLPDGRLAVATRSARQAILALRENPRLQAVMAAELLARERVVLEAGLSREVTATDLYLLHLLGPAGALDFLNELARKPSTPSADILGPAVRTNAGLFIHDGRSLSVGEAYAGIAARLQQQADLYAGVFPPSEYP